MQVDPLLVLIMTGLGYIVYGFLSPSLNPFAGSRREARRRHIRFAQIVGACFALSWVITLFFPMSVLLANLPIRIGMSVLAALVPVGLLCLMVLFSAWRERRAGSNRTNESDRVDALDDEFDIDLGESEPHTVAIGLESDQTASLHSEPDVALEPHTVDDLDVSAIEREAARDQTDLILTEDGRPQEQREQMGRVSELVDNYELDSSPEDELDATSMIHDADRDLPEAGASAPDRARSGADAVEAAQALTTVPESSDTRLQLAELANSNVKLKKLVIAQQAAIDSEKKSHNRTRAIARRAVQVAREAIEGRKSAEKMARREAAERQRATLKAREATAALQNALSMRTRDDRAQSPEER